MREHFVNNQICGENVILVEEEPKTINRSFALEKARQQGLDLVQVSTQNNVPVCKILDYGKFRYEIKKNEKKNKPPVQKEARLRIVTQQHDYERILDKIKEWLAKGYSVKTSIVLKGREKNFSFDARNRLNDVCTCTRDMADYNKIEANNGFLSVVLIPKKNKNGRDSKESIQ